MQKNVVAEDKVSELSEEDVAVSYIGDELDLKTVGDIIAIIEEKVQRTSSWFHACVCFCLYKKKSILRSLRFRGNVCFSVMLSRQRVTQRD